MTVNGASWCLSQGMWSTKAVNLGEDTKWPEIEDGQVTAPHFNKLMLILQSLETTDICSTISRTHHYGHVPKWVLCRSKKKFYVALKRIITAERNKHVTPDPRISLSN